MTRLRRSTSALVWVASCAVALHLVAPRSALAQAAGPESGTAAAADRATTVPVAAQRTSSIDFVRRAVAANGQLSAARLDVERARARLRQAGLLPNPSLDFEQKTGRFTGAAGESETSVGVAVPLELFGQRSSRIDLAEAEVAAAEADIAERERQLASEVRAKYVEALSADRELRIIGELNRIDASTAKFVAVRVSEGESAPLEYRLLQVEIDRLASHRALVEARYEAALVELRNLAGLAPAEPVALGEDLTTVAWTGAPASLGEAIEVALRTRPDLKLARLEERVADAGLRLVRAQSAPEVTAFSRFSIEKSVFDDTPVGVLRDRDKTLSFGVSIGLPVFNRNQGAKAEAAAGIARARKLREYTEQRIRAEVTSAYTRFKAASAAVATFESGVITRSNENMRAIRGAYQIGAYRITELLTEQRRFVDSQNEYIETLAERYRALADLQSAIGASSPFVERVPDAVPEVTGAADDSYPGVDTDCPATRVADARVGDVVPVVVEDTDASAIRPERPSKKTQPE